jgi:hypothetical protein
MATQISLTAVLCMLGMASSLSQAQQAEHAIPSIVQKDGRYALLVDGSPFLMLGVQANNSSAWPATLPKVWAAVDYVHANTLEIPIYWEQFEPLLSKTGEGCDVGCLKRRPCGLRIRFFGSRSAM